MARPKKVRPKHLDCSRVQTMRGDPPAPKPKMRGQLIRANEKDARGRTFTADALREMAARNPKELVYDEDHQALLLRAFAS